MRKTVIHFNKTCILDTYACKSEPSYLLSSLQDAWHTKHPE